MIVPNFENDFAAINLEFYVDAGGYVQVNTAPAYAMLGHYLASEIQGIAVICQELLAMIADIENGDRSAIESEMHGVGNGYGLAISDDKVTIWSEFTNPQVSLELPLAVFKRSLQTYMNFLEQS